MDAQSVRLLRLRSQRLDPRDSTASTPPQVLRDLCGVQAQDLRAAALALRPRSVGLAASVVDRARTAERSVVRGWLMRNTLHMVAAEDYGWLLALLAPVNIAGGKRRRTELGLDQGSLAAGVKALRGLLASGPLTRAEIVEGLAGRGLRLEGQAVPYMLNYATLSGVICHGPDRIVEPAYVLLDDWLPARSTQTRDAALAELARRYVAAYGPASLGDFIHWSGLPAVEARAGWKAIAGEVAEVEVEGKPAWVPASRRAWLEQAPSVKPVVRLLPAFDAYLLGYKARDLALPPEHARRVHPGGGLLRPAVVADGLAVGTWSFSGRCDGLDIGVEAFHALSPVVLEGVQEDAADVGRFYGTMARVKVLGGRAVRRGDS